MSSTPKKRGRKPKPKTDEPVLQKKKRGRKKKCEMHMDAYEKFCGYIGGRESIDAEGNTIKINDTGNSEETNDQKDEKAGDSILEKKSENYENIFFGGLKIKKKNASKQETESLQKLLCEKSKSKGQHGHFIIGCDIDISGIQDSDDDENAKEDEGPKEVKKNLCDYFDDIKVKTNKDKMKSLADSSNKKKYEGKLGRRFLAENSVCKEKDIKILHFQGGKQSLWPKKSKLCCWWCCHTFETQPRFIPTKYDKLRERFRVTGNFCGWSCAKAYYMNDNVFKQSSDSMYIFNRLLQKINGCTISVKSAPPRQALKCFGGPLTIEQFRSVDNNHYYDLNRNVMFLDEGVYLKEKKFS